MSGFTPEARQKAAETRKQRAEERRMRQEMAGIPDSRPFAEPRPSTPLDDFHVGGVLIADMPWEQASRILWQQTDEGIAANNEGKSEHRITVEPRSTRTRTVRLDPNNPEHAEMIAANHGRTCVEIEVPVGTDPFSKQVLAREDSVLNRGMEPWEAPDPLKDTADAHIPAGMKAKFLSPGVMKHHGKRGYEVVKHENGDPVTVGNLVLGYMPESRVKARNAHYRNQGNERLAQVTAQYRAEGGKSAVSDQ